MYFPVNIAKFLRTPILKNIYKRLLLDHVDLHVDIYLHVQIFLLICPSLKTRYCETFR